MKNCRCHLIIQLIILSSCIFSAFMKFRQPASHPSSQWDMVHGNILFTFCCTLWRLPSSSTPPFKHCTSSTSSTAGAAVRDTHSVMLSPSHWVPSFISMLLCAIYWLTYECLVNSTHTLATHSLERVHLAERR